MSDGVNLVTFHPHAWGESNSHRMNADRNPGVPDAYHQAVILRNAAAKAAHDYEQSVERSYMLEHPKDPMTITIEDGKVSGYEHEHKYDLKTLACTYCGKSSLEE